MGGKRKLSPEEVEEKKEIKEQVYRSADCLEKLWKTGGEDWDAIVEIIRKYVAKRNSKNPTRPQINEDTTCVLADKYAEYMFGEFLCGEMDDEIWSELHAEISAERKKAKVPKLE